jgi:anti-sigma factor (TIGR02949 family)
MSACPDKLLLLQAHIDGELDAANALTLEAHLKSCSGCADELGRLEAVRARLAACDLGYAAPDALRARIERQLDVAPKPATPARRADPMPSVPRPRFVPGGAGALPLGRRWSSGVLTGFAVSLALVLAMPQFTAVSTEDQLVANHIRSLSLESHLTDIATSNRHVVKPWFNGKIDFAPPVPELAPQGFPLVGGRLDYIEGHEVAAIVYKRRLHTINVFVRPAGALSLPVGVAARREGYSLVRWTDAGLEFWAVSDIDLDELKLFHRTFESRPSL